MTIKTYKIDGVEVKFTKCQNFTSTPSESSYFIIEKNFQILGYEFPQMKFKEISYGIDFIKGTVAAIKEERLLEFIIEDRIFYTIEKTSWAEFHALGALFHLQLLFKPTNSICRPYGGSLHNSFSDVQACVRKFREKAYR